MSEETLQEPIETNETEEFVTVNGDAPAAEAVSLEEQLQLAQAEAARQLDNYLRSQAELSNARKRFEKQRAQTYEMATGDLVAKLLPILDDFSRAIQNVPEPIQADGWYSGIELVQRKLNDVLEKLNVKLIAAVGQPFDPNFHEALSQEASADYESGVVTRELQKGYRLGDRVIRPSLVYVAE